ncbi:MAG TPA: SDR family oxidoreductase, partial [Streptosporangiaceae bacterium]|nr:SDR family oxidoreductase [Streptosporangiaceae bacterium]
FSRQTWAAQTTVLRRPAPAPGRADRSSSCWPRRCACRSRGDPDEVRARLSEHIPLRRYGEPEEFGRAAAFLLSPAASYITGAMVPVDGGAISSI